MRTLTATLLIVMASAALVWADAKEIAEAVDKAQEQIRKGKTEDALKTANKLLSKDPSAEAQIAGGRLLMILGKRDEAGQAFQNAVAAGADAHIKAEALAALARYELVRASAMDALAHAQAAVQAEQAVNALAVLAMAQARAGNPAVAKATAERAVAADASSSLAHEALGQALLALQSPKEAVAALRKAVQLDPGSASAKVALALALVDTNQAQEAAGIARGVVEAYPNNAEAYGALGLALLASTPNGWGAAIAEAQQGAFLDPRSAVVQYEVGQIFEAGGNLDQALAAYREALKIDPQFGPAAHAAILASYRKGDIDGALAMAKKMADAAPNSGDVQLTLGELLLHKEDYAAAVDVLEKAVKLLPNNGQAYYFLAQAYARSGSRPLDALVEPLQRAVQLEPDQIEYRALLGLALGAADQHAAGIEQLKRVVASPEYKSPEAWINLGFLYRTIEPKQLDECVAAYKKALELDADNLRAYVGLGWAYYYQQKWDDSIAAFQKAAKLDPSFASEAAVRVAWNVFRRDAPTRKFDTVDAAFENAKKAAGADLPSLEKLGEGIEAMKKGAASSPPDIDIDPSARVPEWVRVLNSGANVAQKKRALRELRGAGSEGAPYIASAALRQESIEVREEALRTLEGMGRAVCDSRTLAELRFLANQEPPIPCVDCPREDIERELRQGDLVRKARALYQKLQGLCR